MSAHKTVSLLFGVHAHQPVGNFPEVVDDAHERCYQPFLQVLFALMVRRVRWSNHPTRRYVCPTQNRRGAWRYLSIHIKTFCGVDSAGSAPIAISFSRMSDRRMMAATLV